MIEKKIRAYLESKLQDVPVRCEKQEGEEKYVLIEKAGSAKVDFICTARICVISHDKSQYKASELNELAKTAMEQAVELDDICSIRLNSDYEYNDATKKQYRYQAVYDVVHY